MNSVDIGRCGKRIAQYLWDPEPRNDADPEASIWCLGVEYPPHKRKNALLTTSSQDTGADTNDVTAHGWPEAFLLDFESKVWMTYRSNFPPIARPESRAPNYNMTLSVRLRSQLMEPEGFTSDTGWGCMIRSGQSLLANAMFMLHLGRDWRCGEKAEEEAHILSQFADHPNAPLSIHRFVQHGAKSCGIYPGEWFGPSATARCIETLSEECGNLSPKIYVTNDTSDVHEDTFMSVARNHRGDLQPTLILIATRLGIENVTPVYWDGLKAALQLPQSVGIAGGRPSASHYFVGTQGSHLFYLDPHTTRTALPFSDVSEALSKDISTYHTRRLRRIHVRDMDPSMLIGFLIKNEEDWEDWKRRIMATDGRPIIHIFSKRDIALRQSREEALDEVEALDDE
ncbi:putative cysteine protease atg4 [Aspergillus avenaceus]|uniref:Cysteine protease n=1 Tax=Aspergillus avenaceus TaxID=36643 RepID=A0A5N6TRQ1_ASPAV|nr:putative cysteine protease atg4 [Aspergillus avenaceus]